MVKITHPKMMKGKETQDTAPKTQTFVVENADAEDVVSPDEEINQRIAEFEGTVVPEPVHRPVGPAVETKVQTEDDIQKALENLIFMGRHSKVVELAGHKFELSTLTHKENNDIVAELMNFGEAADMFTVRVLTLAYALRKIDDIKLDDIDVGIKFEDNLQKRMTMIDYLQLGLVERLHKAYEGLIKESESVVFGENIKN